MIPVESVGLNALRRLEEHLAEHPHLRVERSATSITVKGTQDTGFDVQMVDDGRFATILAGGWHDHYEKAEEAAATFMWLLTQKTRIVLSYRGGQIVGWKLQWDEDQKWNTGGRGAVLLGFLVRGAKHEEVLQNRLL